VTRPRFFLDKPNQTGLTKIKHFFPLTYHLKKSLKVKNVV
jgi:hypothetical protein